MAQLVVPSKSVLEAFGLAGNVGHLPGGEEASLVIDGIVLKQVQDVSVSVWSQHLLASTHPKGFRVPAPQPTTGEADPVAPPWSPSGQPLLGRLGMADVGIG